MASIELDVRIQHKRDTAENWAANNIVLLNGERILVDCQDGSVRTKTGDGQSPYLSLPFDDEGLRTEIGKKADQHTKNGGFAGGGNAQTTASGAAVGLDSNSVEGGAIGNCANTADGGAIGFAAQSTTGGAVGADASSTDGGAVGNSARAGAGFSGGYNAIAGLDSEENPIDAIQLGTGTNNTAKTLQIYSYQLMDASGNIPAERLTNAPKTTVVDNLTSTSATDALSANQGKALNDIKADKQNAVGGFVGGNGATVQYGGAIGDAASATHGGAIGHSANTEIGGAVGEHAESAGGGAIGEYAQTTDGGAAGQLASSQKGGAIGNSAKAGDGFSGGYNAQVGNSDDAYARPIDAIQLGTGTNNMAKTLQVYDYTLMNADGTIPAERLGNAGGGVAVIDNLTSTDTDAALSANQGKVLNDTKAAKSTTLAGYGIQDAYTKAEIDGQLGDIESALDGIIALENSYING